MLPDDNFEEYLDALRAMKFYSINNYQQLLLEKSNKQIKNGNLDEKKDAIFIKGFGLSDYSNLLRSLREQKKHGIRQIYDLYKSDIDLIENDEIKLLFNFIPG